MASSSSFNLPVTPSGVPPVPSIGNFNQPSGVTIGPAQGGFGTVGSMTPANTSQVCLLFRVLCVNALQFLLTSRFTECRQHTITGPFPGTAAGDHCCKPHLPPFPGNPKKGFFDVPARSEQRQKHSQAPLPRHPRYGSEASQ